MTVDAVVCDIDLADDESLMCMSKAGGQSPKNRVKRNSGPQKRCKASNDDTSTHGPLVCPLSEDTTTDSTNKYDLPLRIKNKSITYKHVLPSCPTLQLWDVQNKFKFGFIPLGSQLMPEQVSPVDLKIDPITFHRIMADSKEYNYLKNQINLKSQLNPDIWDHYLQDYWDKQLPLLIRVGFPLDYNREVPLTSQETNHASAIQFPDDIQAYLDEEGHHKAILGPFKDIPI